ncbi:MAG: hypothetical protein ACF8R9_15430 [Phycisphaerales bacterium JB054]
MDIIQPLQIDDTTLTSSTVAENDATEWTSGATFDAGEECMVTTTANGASVATHKIYESKSTGNTGNDPTTDTDEVYWEEVGSTNRYKMFDAVVQGQTTKTDGFEVELSPSGYVTGIGFLNLDASSIDILIESGTETVLDENYPLVQYSGVDSWYDYFFLPLERSTSLVVTDLPPILGVDITITFNGSGTVGCGICAIGQISTLGVSLYGPNFSIIDYSTKTQSLETGRAIISQGPYRDVADVPVLVYDSDFTMVKRKLTEVRGTPVVWIPDPGRDGTIIYGFYDRFDLLLSNPGSSELVIRIEGLV